MVITVAKTAGFCFGVNRAIDIVENLAKEHKNVCTLGPIIHNNQMVNKLKSEGVKIIESVEDITKEQTVVIRSHGVPKSTFLTAEEKSKKVKFTWTITGMKSAGTSVPRMFLDGGWEVLK